VAGVVLGVALVGSVLLLATLARGRTARAAVGEVLRGQAPERPDRGAADEDEDRDIPLLEDAVSAEELRRAPAEPPVLTEEVVPGSRSQS
jgi:hypothetical protein